MYVSEGSLVLVVDGIDYPLDASECAVWPSSHAHTIRNDGDVPAVALGVDDRGRLPWRHA